MRQVIPGSALDDAGAWSAIAGASVACLLLVAGLVQWFRKRRRARCLTKWIDAGLALRLRLVQERPDEPTMRASVDEWLVGLQDDLDERMPQVLPDVRAAIVESLPEPAL